MEHLDKTERDLVEGSNQIATLDEYLAWEQRCEKFIEQLEEDCRSKRPRVSDGSQTVGNRSSLVARIARLDGAKTLLQRRFVHIGGEHAAGSSSGNENAERLVWREIDAAFEWRVLTGAVININYIEPRKFLEDAEVIVLDRVRNVVQRHASVKINTVFNGEFVTGDKRANKSVSTGNRELFRASDLREWYELHVIEPTLSRLEEFQERDSGWALSRTLNLTVNVNKYNPLRAECYINLPQKIKSKKAVINVQSMDNACFAWSVVAALYPVQDHTYRESSYPDYTTVLNLQGIEFPMTLKQIKNFENHNNISINVYAIEGEKTPTVLPIRFTDRKKEKHVNLLYVQDPRDDVGHFAWIKNLSRLVSSQLSRYAQANNRYMQSYDTSKPSSYLMYFDVNNLYGWAMCQPLPYADFRWVEDVSNFEFSAIALDSPTGYILEVDLEYPQNKHDAHADLPFCPTRDKPPGKRQDKLLATLKSEAVELRKLEVKFDKPIYVGMCILDISKVCLYEFHHEYMSPLYRDKCRIMYTDTDSLIYHIECEDVYENVKRDIARFDTSDYAIDNAYGITLEKSAGLDEGRE
ncbi:uncharacterized protein LOC143908450 [Temnothorax americanus]|uniref:uncharacterized protein LOC143908450 n=1 Tax=Temnothorax americanus TaxID=1964332 RepID=UPI00406986ED